MVPPLVGLAVKVTEVPAQMVVSVDEMVTSGTGIAFTVI